MKKLTMIVMTAAMAFAMTACGNKTPEAPAAEAVEAATEVVETAAAELSEVDQVKADLKAVLDKVRAAKTMEDINALNDEVTQKMKEIAEKVEANPELQKMLEALGDEYSFEKVMDEKTKELLKK